ncbi:FAD-dependent oxidoreductase [filamentous cyanobacterium LEGE 11480]|uniref:FAD-dependent oxidoreductase n=1 Tax=Romeriopsis navalis LEGE 11480 TaxID=2777977 RepID=A0A928VSD8_9CYAN|nr:NAD(P)/FAD-dependent oxidoreductase [Romeriopsis navalis]MBE9032111.1 FAD-dependent oxidoreductase [Romeriopsis navalis LEGE 11480]
MNTNILIIGGGLAGLSLAHQLQTAGISYHLAEARPRLGGRIHTQTVQHQDQIGHFDTGPTWFWPGQPRIAKIIADLGLASFLQYATGTLSFEDEQGNVFRNRGYASMAGSFRIKGGLTALVDRLHQQLNPSDISLEYRITELQQFPDRIIATGINAQAQIQTIDCQSVVVALPPRVAAHRITFSPPLPENAIQAMQDIPTWMAGQAKIIAVYDRPFWREAGLSGDAMSRRGPMAEIHDASPAEEGPYALFGFVGVPAIHRQTNTDRLRETAQKQLVRLFGPAATNPIELILQDWALEPETATDLDLAPQYSHPAYGLPQAITGLWKNQLIFGSTEVAATFGGYLEGALEVAEIVAQNLIKSHIQK